MSGTDHIEKTIEQLEYHENRLACELVETRNCIAVLRRQFDIPAEPEQDRKPEHLPEPGQKKDCTEPSRTGQRKKPSRTRGGRPPSSQFKGVKKEKKGYADGRDKFSAIYWDPQNKKPEYLGSFDNEYLAAAAYQERAGNKAEAGRLRALVDEHRELNPDRPLDGAGRAALKNRGGTKWVCKRCGLEYLSKGTCADCGDDDMREVPAGE